MTGRGKKDFAVVGIHHGAVVLEANEWNPDIGSHLVVTLYLAPDDALRLANALSLCAVHLKAEPASQN